MDNLDPCDPAIDQTIDAVPILASEASSVRQSSLTLVDHLGDSAGASLDSGREEFRLIRSLGQGGCGRVYLAIQLATGRTVALKTGAKVSREEAKILASLDDHPHVVSVYTAAYDPIAAAFCISMQFIDGSPLSALIGHGTAGRTDAERFFALDGKEFLRRLADTVDKSGSVPTGGLHPDATLLTADAVETLLITAIAMAEALAHAHRRGVLHLDVKPSNILVDRSGKPYLSDFGLSIRDNATTVLGGTLAYMADEQLAAMRAKSSSPDAGFRSTPRVDHRADQYSLAVILFQWCRGSRPQRTRTVDADGNTRDAPERLPNYVPQPLAEVIDRGLQPVTAERFDTTEAMADGLRGCQQLYRAVKELGAASTDDSFHVPPPRWREVWCSFLPHAFCAVLCPTYIVALLARRYSPQEIGVALAGTTTWTAIVFLVIGWLVYRRGARAFRLAEQVRRREPVNDDGVAAARCQAISMPQLVDRLSWIGWLSHAILVPLSCTLLAGMTFDAALQGHLMICLLIGAAVSASYTTLLLQRVTVGRWYLAFWPRATNFSETAQVELAGVRARTERCLVLAAGLPILSACLLILVGPNLLSSPQEFTFFRIFTVGLLMVASLGVFVANRMSHRIHDSLAILQSPEQARE